MKDEVITGLARTGKAVLLDTGWGFRTVDEWVASEVDGSPRLSTRDLHDDRERGRGFAAGDGLVAARHRQFA